MAAYGRFTDYGERFLLRILSGWPTDAGFVCKLFTAPTTDPADDDQDAYSPAFTEAAYTGYSDVTFGFDIPFLLSTSGSAPKRQYAVSASTLCRFMHTGDGSGDTDETVYGWYVTSNTDVTGGADAWIDDTTPIYYRYFDTPVDFAAFMNPVYVLPAWKLFGEEDIPG